MSKFIINRYKIRAKYIIEAYLIYQNRSLEHEKREANSHYHCLIQIHILLPHKEHRRLLRRLCLRLRRCCSPLHLSRDHVVPFGRFCWPTPFQSIKYAKERSPLN